MVLNGPGDITHRRVLVLGDDDRSFLSVIRSLGRRRIEVHTGWCPPGSPALASRYIAENHIIRPFAAGDRSWLDDILEIVESAPFDIVIPCTDQMIIPLRSASGELSRHSLLYLLPDAVYDIVSDKTKTTALAQSLDIPVPEEIEIGSQEEAVRASASFGFPLILKPVSSFTGTDLSIRNKVRKAYDPTELNDLVETMLLRGRLVAQRCLPGHGTGIEILADSGRILFAFQHVRIHEPLRGGGSSYRRSVPLNSDMLDATRRIAAALNYSGVAMFEFRHDWDSGDWRLLEINGRFWGSLPLALASGADFPWYLYQMLVMGRQEFEQKYLTGICCRNLANDIYWNLANLRSVRSDPSLNTLPLCSIVAEAANIITLKERSDTFVRDDMRPGLVQLASLSRAVLRKLFGRVGRPGISRGSGDSGRLKELIPRSEKIHFVCKGNICRSPFAEYYARSVLPAGIEPSSSGYYTPAGRKSPPEAVRAAEEFGIDISGHLSSTIDEEAVRDQDVILAFDEKTYTTILRRFPDVSPRIFRIGLLTDPPRTEISDPFGGDLAEFRKTYRLIKETVDMIAEMAVTD